MRILPEFDDSFRSIVVLPAVTVGALMLVALAIGLLGSWWVRGSLQVAWPKVVFWSVMLPWNLASLVGVMWVGHRLTSPDAPMLRDGTWGRKVQVWCRDNGHREYLMLPLAQAAGFLVSVLFVAGSLTRLARHFGVPL